MRPGAWRISRRTLLRGSGASLALPLLDAMAPATSRAGEPPGLPPKRLFLYIVGGGAYLPYFSIDDSGRREPLAPKVAVEYLGRSEACDRPLGALSPTLAPLEPHKKDLLVLGGLTLANGLQFDDGHSGEIATLLTGAPLSAEELTCDVSLDQVIARAYAGRTVIDALVLGLEGQRPTGARGLGRVYAQHYSWRTPSTPTGEERSPRLVFDRLFRRGAGGSPGDARSAASDSDRRSVLDAALDEGQRLRARVGGRDRAKLDEYLAAVRDVERRIEHAAKRVPEREARAIDRERLSTLEARLPPQKGIPERYQDYDAVMVELVALAFQADLTRVAVLTHGGYRSYPEVDVRRGHHDCQHHEGDPKKRTDLQKIDELNMRLYAGALARFAATTEGESRLLDASMVLFTSGMSNGNRHSRENLPVLLAGRGGGTLRPGRYVDYAWKKRTPICSLYLELLRRMDVSVGRFGDSTGGLAGLTA